MAEHGTRTMYVGHGCRCDACTDANRRYNRELTRHKQRVRYGIEAPREDWVDPTEAREHLLWLGTVGIGRRTIHERTGVAISALTELRQGKQTKIHRSTADKILAVGRSASKPGAYVPAERTWTLIDDLLSFGVTKVSIARALGNDRALQLSRTQVTRRNADLIERLWIAHGRTLPTWHGTYAGYTKRRCRCLRCKKAARDANRARRGSDLHEEHAA